MKDSIIEIVELGQPQSLIQRENAPITELIKTDLLIEELNEQLRLHDVSSCFYLLSETKPPKNGNYEVLTNRGRVVKVNYETLLGNDIWEAGYELHQINESVVAWRFLK